MSEPDPADTTETSTINDNSTDSTDDAPTHNKSSKNDRKCTSIRKVKIKRSFQCSECDFTATKRLEITSHFNSTHAIEKVFKCDECPFTSLQKGSLKNHFLAKHTKVRPFKCLKCKFSCVQSGTLTVHYRTKHPEKTPPGVKNRNLIVNAIYKMSCMPETQKRIGNVEDEGNMSDASTSSERQSTSQNMSIHVNTTQSQSELQLTLPNIKSENFTGHSLGNLNSLAQTKESIIKVETDVEMSDSSTPAECQFIDHSVSDDKKEFLYVETPSQSENKLISPNDVSNNESYNQSEKDKKAIDFPTSPELQSMSRNVFGDEKKLSHVKERLFQPENDLEETHVQQPITFAPTSCRISESEVSLAQTKFITPKEEKELAMREFKMKDLSIFDGIMGPPFICFKCDYKVYQKALLKAHYIAKHTYLKPFKCTYCDYSAVQKGNLKTHIMKKHPQRL